MSARIAAEFERLRYTGGKGFIPFITAGDPDLGTTFELVLRLADLRSTVIELGVPFTDPMADGPVIQRSSRRALEKGGTNIASILDLVRQARKQTDVPIILFGYMNPFLSYGTDRLRTEAADSGVDGFLITDVVDREFGRMAAWFAEKDLDLISLAAPTTTDERLHSISQNARGFVYAVARTGVTGRGAEIDSSAGELVKRVRACTDMPVAVGFGIETREQVAAVQEYADAAVVGSAIVGIIEKCGTTGDPVREVERFVLQINGRDDSEMSIGSDIAL